MFQVLIGILKTNPIRNIPKRRPQFQVLIGILKTQTTPARTPHLTTVSSPYRYSKNIIDMRKIRGISKVSSPYRYSKNRGQREYRREEVKVSSPYRYSKNSLFINEITYTVMFQVLIGILKTVQ